MLLSEVRIPSIRQPFYAINISVWSSIIPYESILTIRHDGNDNKSTYLISLLRRLLQTFVTNLFHSKRAQSVNFYFEFIRFVQSLWKNNKTRWFDTIWVYESFNIDICNGMFSPRDVYLTIRTCMKVII